MWWVIAVMSGVVVACIVVGDEKEDPVDGMMQVDEIPRWVQIGREDFNIPAARGTLGGTYGLPMRGYSGFVDTSGHGTYSPDSVLSVSDGVLDFFLHWDEGRPRVASVVPFGYEGQVYGKYSVRFRYDSLPGYKIAFMLWPVSDVWDEGEIDWPEGELDGALYGASAVAGSGVGNRMTFDPPERPYTPDGPGDWHIATTVWTPGKVKWFWDAELIGETSIPSGVPTKPMRWTLQTETFDAATPEKPGPEVAGHVQVDWVVQYAYRQ